MLETAFHPSLSRHGSLRAGIKLSRSSLLSFEGAGKALLVSFSIGIASVSTKEVSLVKILILDSFFEMISKTELTISSLIRSQPLILLS